MVNIQLGVDIVVLQFMYVAHGFCKKRLTIARKRVGWRQAGEISASCGSGIERYMVLVDFPKIHFPGKMVFPCIPDFAVVIPGCFCIPVIQHRIQRHLKSDLHIPGISRFHTYSDTQPAAGTFSANHELIRSETKRLLSSLQFPPDPGHDHVHEVVLLHLAQLFARLDLVPFLNTATTAGRCCVLCNKHRMTSHRCLFSVVLDHCRGFALCDKIPCMFLNLIQPFLVDIINIRLFQMKSAPKC